MQQLKFSILDSLVVKEIHVDSALYLQIHKKKKRPNKPKTKTKAVKAHNAEEIPSCKMSSQERDFLVKKLKDIRHRTDQSSCSRELKDVEFQ